MLRFGLSVFLASCFLTGQVKCQGEGNSAPGNTPPIESNALSDGAAVGAKDSSIMNVAGQNAVITSKDVMPTPNQPVNAGSQGSSVVLGDSAIQSNLLSKWRKPPTERRMGKQGSFVIPTNNVNMSLKSGTILPIGRSNGSDTPENGPSETTLTSGTDNLLITVPDVADNTSERQSQGSVTASPTTTQANSNSANNSVKQISTVAMVTSKSSPSTITSQTTSSTQNGLVDSTQGTVAPTVTNVGQPSTNGGTIVFKSKTQGGESQSDTYVTTTAAATSDGDVTSAKPESTTTRRETPASVVQPTTLRTTEVTRTENTKVTTELQKQTDTITDTITAEAGTTIIVDNQEITVSPVVDTTKAISSSDEMAKPSTPSVAPLSSSVSTGSAGSSVITTAATSTKSTLPITEGTPVSPVGGDANVACTTLMCINTCEHGRQRDERGCETCKCNFSADCPKPLPTTRLLCMMQIRLGRTCTADSDCLFNRICCPGSCGQSCRRRSSSRRRVLSILKTA